MFPFCSLEVKPHPPTGNLFFELAARQDIRDAGPLWMSGKTICRKAGDSGEPNGPNDAAQRSGDDVRRDLVFDEGDAVAQLQFAFLQPL